MRAGARSRRGRSHRGGIPRGAACRGGGEDGEDQSTRHMRQSAQIAIKSRNRLTLIPESFQYRPLECRYIGGGIW